MPFVYLVYFSRSPFGEGGKRIQSNVLLASHHWENKMTSLLFQFFLGGGITVLWKRLYVSW